MTLLTNSFLLTIHTLVLSPLTLQYVCKDKIYHRLQRKKERNTRNEWKKNRGSEETPKVDRELSKGKQKETVERKLVDNLFLKKRGKENFSC